VSKIIVYRFKVSLLAYIVVNWNIKTHYVLENSTLTQ